VPDQRPAAERHGRLRATDALPSSAGEHRNDRRLRADLILGSARSAQRDGSAGAAWSFFQLDAGSFDAPRSLTATRGSRGALRRLSFVLAIG
jgi:hypothetical protein